MEKTNKILYLDTYKYLGQEWLLYGFTPPPLDYISIKSSKGYLVLHKIQQVIGGLNKGKYYKSPMHIEEIGMMNG